jgi:hypothetical protein
MTKRDWQALGWIAILGGSPLALWALVAVVR